MAMISGFVHVPIRSIQPSRRQRDKADRALKRGVFRSVRDLEQAIEEYIEATNADPKPFC